MKIPTQTLATSVTSIALLLLLGQPLSAKEEHPAMHDASEALHAAQGSSDPIAKLEEARRHLNIAKANKQGYRIEALKLTEEAIADVKAGKRAQANKAITEALNLIEKGVALHPRDKRR